MKLRDRENVARVKLNEDDRLSVIEGAFHEWLLEPCVTESLKQNSVIGRPRVIIKEKCLTMVQPQTLTNNATEENYCM